MRRKPTVERREAASPPRRLWQLLLAACLLFGLLSDVFRVAYSYAGLRVPQAFDRAAELLVAAMLIGLGLWHLSRGSGASSPKRAASPARPLTAGLVHGLAGSAGVALLATATIRSQWWATLYLALFGLGTVLGMALLTAVLSWPLGWTARQERPFRRLVAKVPGALSLGLGLFMGLECLGHWS